MWTCIELTLFKLYSACRFDEKFEGVLLAYEAKIIDKSAKILSGVHPYFAVTIKAKLLLFSPKPNMLLGWFSMILTVLPLGKTTHLEFKLSMLFW